MAELITGFIIFLLIWANLANEHCRNPKTASLLVKTEHQALYAEGSVAQNDTSALMLLPKGPTEHFSGDNQATDDSVLMLRKYNLPKALGLECPIHFQQGFDELFWKIEFPFHLVLPFRFE